MSKSTLSFEYKEDPYIKAVHDNWIPTDELFHQFSLYLTIPTLYKIINQFEFVKPDELKGLQEFVKMREEKSLNEELPFQDLLLLALIYEQGAGVKKDPAVEARYYLKSIEAAERYKQTYFEEVAKAETLNQEDKDKLAAQADKLQVADLCILIASLDLWITFRNDANKQIKESSKNYLEKVREIMKRYPNFAYSHYIKMILIIEDTEPYPYDLQKQRAFREAMMAQSLGMLTAFIALGIDPSALAETEERMDYFKRAAMAGSPSGLMGFTVLVFPNDKDNESVISDFDFDEEYEEDDEEDVDAGAELHADAVAADYSEAEDSDEDSDNEITEQEPELKEHKDEKEEKVSEPERVQQEKEEEQLMENQRRAIKFLEYLAEEHNHVGALILLGDIYAGVVHDDVIPPDYNKGIAYYIKAAMTGDKSAMKKLIKMADWMDNSTQEHVAKIFYKFKNTTLLEKLFVHLNNNEAILFYLYLSLLKMNQESDADYLKKPFLEMARAKPAKFAELAESDIITDEDRANIINLLGNKEDYNKVRDLLLKDLKQHVSSDLAGMIAQFGFFESALETPKEEKKNNPPKPEKRI